jgi:hypothetical protein
MVKKKNIIETGFESMNFMVTGGGDQIESEAGH